MEFPPNFSILSYLDSQSQNPVSQQHWHSCSWASSHSTHTTVSEDQYHPAPMTWLPETPLQGPQAGRWVLRSPGMVPLHAGVSPTEYTFRFLSFFFFFLKILFIFRERGREREREGKTHQCVVASHTPTTGDLAHNPGMCPDRELNQWPFDLQASAQSTEPHQPGHT